MDVLEHIGHILGIDERVIDGHYLYAVLLQGRAQNKSANTTEAVDTDFDYFDSHGQFAACRVGGSSEGELYGICDSCDFHSEHIGPPHTSSGPLWLPGQPGSRPI